MRYCSNCISQLFLNKAKQTGSYKPTLTRPSGCLQGTAGVSTTLQGRPRAPALKHSSLKAPGLGHIDWSAGPHPVERKDLVLAIPTDNLHLELVEAGRQWHKVRS